MQIRELRELSDILPSYDYTSKLSRDRWAWEFCRREPELRDMAHFYSARGHVRSQAAPCPNVTLLKLHYPQPEADACGLCFFPNPDLDAIAADVFWSAERYPREVCVHVVGTDPGVVDEYLALALQRCQITHLTCSDATEQFILRGAGRALQVRAEGLSLLSDQPHKMVLTIEGDECFDSKVETLKKAHGVYGSHDDGPPQWSRGNRDLRDALICLDAREAGLSYWEMAEIICGRSHVQAIRGRGSRALKDAMRRNLRRGLALRDGGFRDLLLPKTRGVHRAA